ncbi:DEAD/DEAH box helicase family protein [Natronosalvus rutilus]|uniref:DNA 3'-5' helicase n=1 Tax=Natronosalvus rutilus TaxID=2953753 RepID=A0A9E7N685_9EURY|nr:DEAD/DEAH box helicase family protein [Natronosalvus rutilus]UTF52305.1 DEAD/DEAH box helicase family protein [Natronosalvus rutilus]
MSPVGSPSSIRLRYEDGTIRIEAPETGAEALLKDATLATVELEFDPRSDTLRTEAVHYTPLRAALARRYESVQDGVLATANGLPEGLASEYELRSYQRTALERWFETDRWEGLSFADGGPSHPAPAGVLELPTGSGKTVIAIEAIERLAVPTLVVVPTIDLLEQWATELEAEFDVPVGRFGGGEQRLEALTVSTYDSAYLKADAVGDRFGFVVFDEVHHLGGEGYRQIARLLAAPARLGLTATFERPDDAHEVIEELVGPVVHRLSPDDLAGEHLAPYDVKRRKIELTERERENYERHQGTFTDYLARSNIRMQSGSDYQELVKRSGSDPAAREALLARQRAREIMLGAEGKIEALAEVLETHRGERTIVFTAYNDLAYEVGERFLIPVITHQTGTAERREILERFRDGTYSRVVTSNVLDEGVDVPDASVAVVLSGSGSEREFTQRLGRILRPKDDGGRAILYELVAAETSEESIADRRR